MGHHQLREDKTCLNCGNEVQGRFCSNCGQENVESRHSFHYLFTHFLEDLLHYDGSFWKTIKSLLFKPGKLTVEYLKGKRASYVAPVKLYIFIAFVAFFVPAVVAYIDKDPANELVKVNGNEAELAEQIKNSGVSYGFKEGYDNIKSLEQLDSLQNAYPEGKKLNWVEYKIMKKNIEFLEHGTEKDFQEKFMGMLGKNFSKVLFVYMPIFAFLLWLFHGKKRWYYFDHGIFTLHYFSFLLILSTLFILFEFLTSLIGVVLISDILNLLAILIVLFYPFFYFFRAHSKVYGEKKWISRVKSFVLFLINLVCISMVAIIYLLVIAWNM